MLEQLIFSHLVPKDVIKRFRFSSESEDDPQKREVYQDGHRQLPDDIRKETEDKDQENEDDDQKDKDKDQKEEEQEDENEDWDEAKKEQENDNEDQDEQYCNLTISLENC